jgi:hypothetical protein
VPEQALIDERGEALDCRAGNSLCRRQRAASGEYGQAQQVVELVFVEEIEGPVERRA